MSEESFRTERATPQHHRVTASPSHLPPGFVNYSGQSLCPPPEPSPSCNTAWVLMTATQPFKRQLSKPLQGCSLDLSSQSKKSVNNYVLNKPLKCNNNLIVSVILETDSIMWAKPGCNIGLYYCVYFIT